MLGFEYFITTTDEAEAEEIMEKWALVVGCDGKKLDDMKQICANLDLSIHYVFTLQEAIEMLAIKIDCLIVVVSMHNTDKLAHINAIRVLTNAPIIALKEDYIGAEKIAVIEAGADEYIQWPESIQELEASCYALLRRFTVWDRSHGGLENMVIHKEIFIHKDYRKVFIHGIEVLFTQREFDFFSLLAAYPERVFTYRQLSDMIWGDELMPIGNSLHSCVRRIRRKLEGVPECPCSIVNMHSVGYFFRHNNP